MNNTTTMNLYLNQKVQSTKIECKKERSINIPYFFSTLEKKNNINKIDSSKKVKNVQNKTE